jgi:hypothetical protein
MSMFTSDIDRKAQQFSPDRVDALVWGLTELLVEPMAGANVFEIYRRLAHGETLEQIAGTAAPTSRTETDLGPLSSGTETQAEAPPAPKVESLLEVYRREAAAIAAGKTEMPNNHPENRI